MKVAQSRLTLCNLMDCSPPGSSVYGILQARMLEWVAIPFSRDLPDPGIKPGSPTLQADSLLSEPLGKPILLTLTHHIQNIRVTTVDRSAAEKNRSQKILGTGGKEKWYECFKKANKQDIKNSWKAFTSKMNPIPWLSNLLLNHLSSALMKYYSKMWVAETDSLTSMVEKKMYFFEPLSLHWSVIPLYLPSPFAPFFSDHSKMICVNARCLK